MSDLISRRATIKRLEEFANDDMISVEKAIGADCCIELIRVMPSAQPEIIRCKDCKWWDFTPDNTMLPDWHRCRCFGKIHIRYEDFCSRGERRTDE